MRWDQRWESLARLESGAGDVVGEINITNGFWDGWAHGGRVGRWPSAQRQLAMQAVQEAVLLQPV